MILSIRYVGGVEEMNYHSLKIFCGRVWCVDVVRTIFAWLAGCLADGGNIYLFVKERGGWVD